MRIRRARWLLFALSIEIATAVPLGILWDTYGVFLGSALTLLVLLWIGRRPLRRLEHSADLQRITRAEHPVIFSTLEELGRRLKVEIPRVFTAPSAGINFAVFGVGQSSASIVLTEGCLSQLSREELTFVLTCLTFELKYGSVHSRTWLALFLESLGGRLPQWRTHRVPAKRPIDSPLLLLPIAYLPSRILEVRPATPENPKHRLHGFLRIWNEIEKKAEAQNPRTPWALMPAVRGLFYLPVYPTTAVDTLFGGPLRAA